MSYDTETDQGSFPYQSKLTWGLPCSFLAVRFYCWRWSCSGLTLGPYETQSNHIPMKYSFRILTFADIWGCLHMPVHHQGQHPSKLLAAQEPRQWWQHSQGGWAHGEGPPGTRCPPNRSANFPGRPQSWRCHQAGRECWTWIWFDPFPRTWLDLLIRDPVLKILFWAWQD